MAGLDDAKEMDLAKRAEELAQEAERLRQGTGSDAARESEADEELSASIEKLRRIARS